MAALEGEGGWGNHVELEKQEHELSGARRGQGLFWHNLKHLLQVIRAVKMMQKTMCTHGASRDKFSFKVCTISLARCKFRYGIKL